MSRKLFPTCSSLHSKLSGYDLLKTGDQMETGDTLLLYHKSVYFDGELVAELVDEMMNTSLILLPDLLTVGFMGRVLYLSSLYLSSLYLFSLYLSALYLSALILLWL